MGLGRSGQKVGHGTLVHRNGGCHDLGTQGSDLGSEAFAQVPVDDPAEDELHGVVVKLVYGDGVEVAEESGSDRVASTARGAHGCVCVCVC